MVLSRRYVRYIAANSDLLDPDKRGQEVERSPRARQRKGMRGGNEGEMTLVADDYIIGQSTAWELVDVVRMRRAEEILAGIFPCSAKEHIATAGRLAGEAFTAQHRMWP